MENKTDVKAHLFCVNSSAHPDVKRSSEVIQIGLNETEVFQAKLGAATLGSDQWLLFVLYEDDLEHKQKKKKDSHQRNWSNLCGKFKLKTLRSTWDGTLNWSSQNEQSAWTFNQSDQSKW